MSAEQPNQTESAGVNGLDDQQPGRASIWSQDQMDELKAALSRCLSGQQEVLATQQRTQQLLAAQHAEQAASDASLVAAIKKRLEVEEKRLHVERKALRLTVFATVFLTLCLGLYAWAVWHYAHASAPQVSGIVRGRSVSGKGLALLEPQVQLAELLNREHGRGRGPQGGERPMACSPEPCSNQSS